MKIHEYQAKEILKSYGVPVPKGGVAETPEEGTKDCRRDWRKSNCCEGADPCRGQRKGWGVKIVTHPKEEEKAAKEILGMTLVTHQTGPADRLVRKFSLKKG